MDLYSRGLPWLPADPQHPLYESSFKTFQIAYASSTLDDKLTKFFKSDLVTGAFLVALVALFLRTLTNRKVPKCLATKPDVLVAFKTLFAVVYTAGTVALLMYAHKESLAEWVLPSVAVATAIAFASASISEHYHSIAPSTLTALYAVVSAAFYVYTFLDLRELQAPLGHLFAASTIAFSLFVLIFLESVNKRSLLIPIDPAPAYETTLSFFAKPFFPHIVPILFTGARRRLTLPELRDIPLYLRSDPATDKLLAALANEDSKNNRYLVRSTFRAFTGHFLSPVLPRLLMLTCTFAQVTLVEAMVSYVADKSIPKERGYGLVVAYFVVYVSLAIANYVYAEKVNAFIVLYRSALTGALYAKTLRLTSMAARELGQGAATTYMSVDVEKATSGFQTLQELWAAVLTIIVACAMLWAKAGYVMFAPLLFIITLLFSTSTISRFVGAAQKAWLKAIDARIKLLTSVLNQLLPIKLGAYEVPLAAKVNALRALETQTLGRFISLIGVAGTLSNIGGAASFVVTLAAYAFMLSRGLGDLPPLDVSQIFTLFTIVNVLNGPLNMIGQTLPQLFASFASLTRIQGFLQLPEKAEIVETIGVSTAPTLVDVSIGDDDGVAKASASASSTPSVSLSLDGTAAAEVALEGCSFKWDAQDKDKTATATATPPVLKDITLKLVPRKLHMVVGSVASGKSSLLMSILGETTLVEGTVKVDAHRIALASQTAFIYPGTLRANILLDSEYDEEFYEQVIHACALRQDIELLPRRDMTKLGDKGSTLSGGQRQRLAIARAVYARADLVLLDDVFSALDGETEAHVFASLFGPEGMLRGKTTVLVTHGVHHLPSADKVIIMDAGTITHFGSFEEVRDAGATFALAATTGNAGHGEVMTKESATAATITDEELDEELNWNIEQSSRNGAYAFYIKCTGVIRVGIFFTLIVIWSSIGIFSTAYLSMLASSSGKHLALWVLGYAGIVAAQLTFMGITLQAFGYILSRFTAPNIHGAELSGVMGSPISWITKNPVGKVLNRFSQDIQVADQEFPFAFINFAINVLGTVGTFVFITLAAPLLAFALPVLIIGGAYFLKFYLATSKQFRRLESASKSPLYTLFGTTVTGLITVRAYRAQKFFRAQNAAFVNESQGAMHHRVAGQLFLRVFLLWFQTILACSVAVLTVWLRDQTDAAFLGIALSRLVSLGMGLTHLLSSYASVENGGVAIERIAEFARLPEEEKERTVTADDYSAWPSTGGLAFSNFSMKYRDDLPLALKNLSFDLQGGLKIGICGRTGSGKSSTVLALFRGIDQHLVTGKIVIDGVDISTVPIHHVRESMSIVTQDPFLWHGSIRENLDVTNERTDSEIWEALKLVEMYDAVSALEDKLDHLVVDEESFSKGQRQLLCLTRALLRRRKIIVLDESTSSMDHITDEKIRHVVDTQMKDLTVLAIAHRISTIVNYDKILVLDSGSIAEFDDPKVLLANPESRFARLAATQGIYHPDLVPNDATVKELSDGTVMVVTEDLIDV
ncbi:P-loop containing nucleoside triphosphate hydrolase protein [Mycena alexandri]|uniref:P-loop containing nucleoside triphosphate hydrolase protein n=1 Tax=Mycena alexandri TaxID=1745969 RepID=A0AAD6X1K9_9AGAR|nr:P-loop containing nucleoside triphosphate hydrolase protein [Mycena alexandri]